MVVVFPAFCAKVFPVQGNGFGGYDDPATGTSFVWREEPLPTEHITLSKGLNGNRLPFGYERHFNCYLAMVNYVKPIGFPPRGG